jgi:hypothetical protein
MGRTQGLMLEKLQYLVRITMLILNIIWNSYKNATENFLK